MKVAQRGTDMPVAHEPLNGVHIDSGFQQMRGKGMAQPVDAAVLGDAGSRLGGVEDLLRRGGANRLIGQPRGGKQPQSWPVSRPVAAQLREQPWAQAAYSGPWHLCPG